MTSCPGFLDCMNPLIDHANSAQILVLARETSKDFSYVFDSGEKYLFSPLTRCRTLIQLTGWSH